MRVKILNASAGSGKTFQLAYNYVRDVVEEPAIYRHILAVTFTNKATEEMKSRILKEIHALAEGKEGSYRSRLRLELSLTDDQIRQRATEARSKILHDYSRFTVLTIDTFFQRILRAFLKELNLDLNYNIELETASVLSESVDTLIEEIATNKELLQWMTRFVEERIEEGRSWDVRYAILSLGDELFKEANKAIINNPVSREELQRVVGQSIARSEAAQARLKARAREAVEIIDSNGGSVVDFPYKERGFATWFYQLAEGKIYGYGARVQAAIEEDEKWGKPKSLSQTLRPTLQPILRELTTIYDSSVRQWNTTVLLRETYRSLALLSDLYTKVQDLCDKQQLMFLSETKYLLSEFVSHNDAPFIYEKVGNRFDRFLIDEFQDTSVKEWENFLPLLENAKAQVEEQRTVVLLVGDIKQSIYRWRGSDWRILHTGAVDRLGEENTEVVNLTDNWRSLPMVVAFNNEAISRMVEEDNTQLNTWLANAVSQGDLRPNVVDELRNTLADAYQTIKQIPRRGGAQEGYISISTYKETPPIVERICEVLDRGFSPSDIMILVRSSTDGARVAAELLDFKRANTDPRYRFDVMTRDALVIGSAPISRFVVAAFRLALNSEDSLARAQYNHYLGLAFDQPFSEEDRHLFRTLCMLPPEEAFERLVLYHNLQHDSSETAYLQAIHEQILAFSTNRIADLALFISWWEEQGAQKSLVIEQQASAIEVTTIHKAKGLEKPVILIPYCKWALDPKPSWMVNNIVWSKADDEETASLGRFPVRFKSKMAQSAFSADYFRETVFSHVDHINLLYVAFTRAAEELHIFLPQDGGAHVGMLLQKVLQHDGAGGASIGSLVGRYTADDESEQYEFGSCSAPVREEKPSTVESVVMTDYPTSEADLRLRLPSQRYFEEENQVELSPRNFGILMHRAFEQAEDEEQIEAAIVRMLHDGSLSEEDAAQLRQMVQQALGDPIVRSWFDGSWEQVMTERQIVLPRALQTRRPDRVMISGQRAVVVDYKFGERHAARYRDQIKAYCELLRKMGYTEVEGWLWYVKLGKIESVV